MVFDAIGPRERGVSIELPGHHTARKVRRLSTGLTCATDLRRCAITTLGALAEWNKV